MIPVLHILGQGGILSNSNALSVHNEVAFLLEIASYCAVNSYAIISGYVGYEKKQKYSNILYLCFQVSFYIIVTTVVFYFFKPETVNLKTAVLEALFPFAYNTYWYFSAYFCLFFFMPFLNMVLDKFDRKNSKRLLLLLFFIFSLLPTIFHTDLGCTKSGYSFLWLGILYLAGAYIKKYNFSVLYTNRANLIGYFICVIVTWLSKAFIEVVTKILFGQPKGGNYLLAYTSPTMVLCSVFLLLFFANIKCGKKLTGFIKIFAPLSFGVYLFHEESLIRDNFINNAFIGYLSLNPFIMVLAVLGTAIFIWLIGSLVDKIRLSIFKLLRVKQFSVFIEQKITCMLYILKKKISLIHHL